MPGSLGNVSDRGSFCKLPTGPLAARPQVWAALPCTDGAVSRGGYRRAFNVMVFSVLSYGNQKWRLAGRGQRKRCPEAGCGRSWWQPCWPVGTAVPQVPRRNEAGPARRSALALPPLAHSLSLQPGTPPVCPEGRGAAARSVALVCGAGEQALLAVRPGPGSRRCWPCGRAGVWSLCPEVVGAQPSLWLGSDEATHTWSEELVRGQHGLPSAPGPSSSSRGALPSVTVPACWGHLDPGGAPSMSGTGSGPGAPGPALS